MKPFRNIGIQSQLHRMTLFICSAVLLVATLGLFAFQVWNFRKNFQNDNFSMAGVMADLVVAPVEFEQADGADSILSALKSNPFVISSTIVLPDGTLMAHYGKLENTNSLAQFPAHTTSEFVNGQLLVVQPIIYRNHDRVGTLYTRFDYQRAFVNLLKFYGWLIGGVIVVSFCLSVLLSKRLSRNITKPILDLAVTAEIVGEQKDYSVRVNGEKRGDELGKLMDSFNEMLDRIESQDAALSLSEEKMKALIHSIDGIVWERTPDNHKFTFVSRQVETILGYSSDAWLQNEHLWTDKLHPQDSVRAVTTAYDVARAGKNYAFEYRMIAADGRVVWIRESGSLMVENDKPIAVRGIMQDITRQKNDAEQLDKLNRQLMDASRAAGMADVATGVLHNVGNVLNSVSVAATIVGERLQRSKITGLQRATALMREQNGNLANYLTADPKGKLLPTYIDTLAEQLVEEREELIGKLQSVAQNIEHIKEIVAMQQSYAKVSGAYENLMASELIEDALRINIAAFDRHQIKVVRQFAPQVPPVCVDRHKVLQILINLLRNAKHAMEDMQCDHKELVIDIRRETPETVVITVRDCGIGIPETNLTKIFNHGFTTKKDGHGFGLHSGANSAKEMGGSLTAHSDGPGKGAEFRLSLPVSSKRKDEIGRN